VLLPLLAKATAAQQQREEKRRREAGGDDEWEEEYVLCEFDDAELNLDGEILVQVRARWRPFRYATHQPMHAPLIHGL